MKHCKRMILVDAHVHIYECFNLEAFFNSAYRNFENEADRSGLGNDFSAVLLLAETPRENWFHRLPEVADEKRLPRERETGNWRFYHTDDPCSLQGRSGDNGELFVIAGRQVVTEEGLEVLCLGSTCSFPEGLPVEGLIKKVRDAGGIPIIPWGFGKWAGRRGAILDKALRTAQENDFFLGDSANRPSFLPYPSQLKRAEERNIRNLPGSDPLPFRSGQKRAGSFGFSVSEHLDKSEPSKHLKEIVANRKIELRPYGEPMGVCGFTRSQMRLLLRKIPRSASQTPGGNIRDI